MTETGNFPADRVLLLLNFRFRHPRVRRLRNAVIAGCGLHEFRPSISLLGRRKGFRCPVWRVILLRRAVRPPRCGLYLASFLRRSARWNGCVFSYLQTAAAGCDPHASGGGARPERSALHVRRSIGAVRRAGVRLGGPGPCPTLRFFRRSAGAGMFRNGFRMRETDY